MGLAACSLKTRRLADPVPVTLDHLNPKPTGFGHGVEDYDCAKFQVIPIRGFRFIVLINTRTHPQTETSISAPPDHVIGRDNKNN